MNNTNYFFENGRAMFCACNIFSVLGVRNGKEIIDSYVKPEDKIVKIKNGVRYTFINNYGVRAVLERLKDIVDYDTRCKYISWVDKISDEGDGVISSNTISEQVQEQNIKLEPESEIRIFENPEFGQIRTAGTPENPLFCLSDVCKVLGLTSKGVNQRLTDEVISNYPIIDRLGRTQQALFVNEDGLYDVILDSRKPEAKAFRKWITSEVLPSIRKHGAYMVKDLLDRVIKDPDFLIGIANEIKNANEARMLAEKESARKQEQLELQAPKVEFYDTVTKSESMFDMNEVAKVLNFKNIGRNNLFKILRAKGILDAKNQPYQEYVAAGYFKLVENNKVINSETRVFPQTVVFQKGLDYIHKILKEYVNSLNDNNQNTQLNLF